MNNKELIAGFLLTYLLLTINAYNTEILELNFKFDSLFLEKTLILISSFSIIFAALMIYRCLIHLLEDEQDPIINQEETEEETNIEDYEADDENSNLISTQRFTLFSERRIETLTNEEKELKDANEHEHEIIKVSSRLNINNE